MPIFVLRNLVFNTDCKKVKRPRFRTQIVCSKLLTLPAYCLKLNCERMTNSAKETVNLLILGPFGNGRGNNTTAHRIRQYMLEFGYECEVKEAASFANVDALHQYLAENHVTCILGIHAVWAGKLLQDVCCPYGLIFGGTDVNEYGTDPRYKDIMLQAVTNARVLIALAQFMLDGAVKLWPAIVEKKLFVIPQGVITSPTPGSARADWLASQHLPSTGRLFTLVAGLRPVKDPLYLLETFSQWHQLKQPHCHLVIAGRLLDEELSLRFMKTIEGLAGVIYVGVLSLADTHRLIAESFALVNSSLSEGVAASVLEAMTIGVPAIVRNIPGNTAVVTDMQTGLVYDTPQEFIEKCEMLIDSDGLREYLRLSAQQYVQKRQNPQREKHQYSNVINELIRGIEK